MNIFCRIFGHTWTHRTEDPPISWNTTKGMAVLEATAHGEPRFWLECQRCADKNENPSKEQIKKINN
ncbi:MAG: hypothetical protein ACI8QC_003099 [Planctomycetota bacterium]|jgi:hypothetical protein